MCGTLCQRSGGPCKACRDICERCGKPRYKCSSADERLETSDEEREGKEEHFDAEGMSIVVSCLWWKFHEILH